MEIKAFRDLLPLLCAKDTAADNGQGWTPENPMSGHCAVASLLAQDAFGGELLRISLDGTPFAHMRSHYFNRLADGTVVDFTADQFGGWSYDGITVETRTRNHVVGGSDTLLRYELLKGRLYDAMMR